MARATDVKHRVPKIDGYVLDLVIDFVTCVVVPVAFIYQFDLLPSSVAVAVIGGAVFTSAIWFSRTDMMTDDHWFRGFPATWNLVAPSLYLLDVAPAAAAVIVVVLSVASLTDLPFPHPVRVVWMRPVTLTITAVWLVAMTVAVLDGPAAHTYIEVWLVIGPLAFVALSVAKLIGLDTRSIAVHPTK